MHMKKMLMVGVFSVAAMAGHAHAGTLAACSGEAWIPSDAQYFSRGWAKVHNTAGSEKLLMIPVPISGSAGNRTFTARVEGRTDGGGGQVGEVRCSALVINSDNGRRSWSGWIESEGMNMTFQTLSLGTMYVYSGDTAQVECYIGTYYSLGSAYPAAVSVSWSPS
jgi:hypothetical protein